MLTIYYDILLQQAIHRPITEEEAYFLLRASGESKENEELLFEAARSVRRLYTDDIFYFSGGIASVLPCNLKPLCNYCPYWRKSDHTPMPIPAIAEAARYFQEQGIRAFHLSGGTTLGSDGMEIYEIVKAIWDAGVRGIDIMVNCGAAMNVDTMKKISEMGVRSIGATFETTNSEIFAQAKPGDDLEFKLNFARDIEKAGVGLATGLMAGLGPDDEDERFRQYAKSLFDVSQFSNLKSIYISKFTPAPTIPMKDKAPCSLSEAARYLAVARLMLRNADVTCAAGWMGHEREYSIHAGAGNSLFTVGVNLKPNYWTEYMKDPDSARDNIEFRDTRPQHREAAKAQGFTIEE